MLYPLLWNLSNSGNICPGFYENKERFSLYPKEVWNTSKHPIPTSMKVLIRAQRCHGTFYYFLYHALTFFPFHRYSTSTEEQNEPQQRWSERNCLYDIHLFWGPFLEPAFCKFCYKDTSKEKVILKCEEVNKRRTMQNNTAVEQKSCVAWFASMQ